MAIFAGFFARGYALDILNTWRWSVALVNQILLTMNSTTPYTPVLHSLQLTLTAWVSSFFSQFFFVSTLSTRNFTYFRFSFFEQQLVLLLLSLMTEESGTLIFLEERRELYKLFSSIFSLHNCNYYYYYYCCCQHWKKWKKSFFWEKCESQFVSIKSRIKV